MRAGLGRERRVVRWPPAASHVELRLRVYWVMTMKMPFEHVVDAHGATVLRVCRAVLGPHADADDAWSETFLAALRAYPSLEQDANVEAWLVTIAHRKAIDVTRARARRAVPTQNVPDRASVTGLPGELHHDVWDALACLPSKQRQVIAYHYLGGLPYRDVAELLGGTTDAARRAAFDGMTSLRSAYLAKGRHTEGASR